ncbi:MAG: 2,3-bisphosphoglycerate-independent phosphoglycerate mutase [Patescibacteria group bacterium]
MKTKNPVILIIRDGWGYNKATKDNPISLANTPNEDFYIKNYASGLLAASGEAVGLEKGYQGNSEVGHLTLGSGRIMFQSMTRIDKAISSGEFFKNKILLEVINKCKKNKTSLHLIGLLQTQGVHSHIKHLFALLDLCKKNNFKNVLIHAITDGRDAPVTESLKHLKALENKIKNIGFGKIVTVSGRYYAIDRNSRWERTKEAYDCIVLAQGEEYKNAITAVKLSHKNGVMDEFVKPMKLVGYEGFKKNDGVIFFNFRTDRPRQLTAAIVEDKFKGFKRQLIPVNFVAMTQYYEPMKAKVVFPNISLKNLLGDVISSAGMKQLRISETEKYAHVTFFFNGQNEKANKGESRVLILSPKVATYDLQPEMSVFKIAERLVSEIKTGKYDFIVTNLVNGDMVGHTGKIKSIIKAVESVDKAQGEIVKAALAKNYTCLLIADHGNAEDKRAATATSHTTNPVPVLVISNDKKIQESKIVKGAGLKDVAPTILKILGLYAPREMSGKSFLNY